MNTAEYLDRLLLRYSGSFNIYQPYVINGKEYPAYGCFYSFIEKYILVREANMWSTRSYEHILFMEVPECTETTLQEAESIIRDYMEPVLVRNNEKVPEKDHMYSYLNIVIVCEQPVVHTVAGEIKHFHFEKGYRFNFRGYSKGSIMCVSLADRKYLSNFHCREKKKMFLQIFDEVEQGKPGFAAVMEEKGLKPYKQELL